LRYFDAIDLLITLRMLGAAAGAHEADKEIDRYIDVALQGLRAPLTLSLGACPNSGSG
jgi:hypothetical protein